MKASGHALGREPSSFILFRGILRTGVTPGSTWPVELKAISSVTQAHGTRDFADLERRLGEAGYARADHLPRTFVTTNGELFMVFMTLAL